MYAVFGGSFDPIHQGHLETASRCAAVLGCRVHLLPSARSPLKQALHITDGERVILLKAAIEDRPELGLDLSDIERPAPSYAVETLARLRAALPDQPLLWIMGQDSLANLHKWRDWQRLTELANVVVINREPVVPLSEPVSLWLAKKDRAGLLRTLTFGVDNQVQWPLCGLIAPLSLPPQPYSSTALREQLSNKPTLRPQGLPEAVWQLIKTHHLYAPQNNARHEAP